MSKQTKKPIDEELEQEEVLEEETVDTEPAEAAEEPVEEPAEEPAEEPSDDLANLQKALEEEQNRYLRLMAEYDNFRKRSAREKDGIYTDAKADTFTSLLPVLDNFDRAFENEDASPEDFRKGKPATPSTRTSTMRSATSKTPNRARTFWRRSSRKATNSATKCFGTPWSSSRTRELRAVHRPIPDKFVKNTLSINGLY